MADFLRSLSLPSYYDPLISVSYITFVAILGRGQTDRTSQRASGWPDLATEPGWRNEEGKREKERRREREDCGEKKVWTLKTNLSRFGEEEEEGGSNSAAKALTGPLTPSGWP